MIISFVRLFVNPVHAHCSLSSSKKKRKRNETKMSYFTLFFCEMMLLQITLFKYSLLEDILRVFSPCYYHRTYGFERLVFGGSRLTCSPLGPHGHPPELYRRLWLRPFITSSTHPNEALFSNPVSHHCVWVFSMLLFPSLNQNAYAK